LDIGSCRQVPAQKKASKNMPATAKIAAMGDQQAQKVTETGRNQLAGESGLWFRRYCLYRDLGHKRSLRAAVAKERETAHLVRPAPATKSTENKKAGGQKRAKTVAPPPAPTPAINVPGSWKNACKVYRWAERAQAFDAYLIDMMVKTTYATLGNTYANKYKRIQLLELLLKSTLDQLNNATANSTTHKTYLAYIKQLSALTAQMEREMSKLSDEEMKEAIAAYGCGVRDEVEKACGVGNHATKKA
jgi:hypothetical protein